MIPSCSAGQSQQRRAEVSRRCALGSNEKEFLLIGVVHSGMGSSKLQDSVSHMIPFQFGIGHRLRRSGEAGLLA